MNDLEASLDDAAIGRRLKEYRNARGWSRMKLALEIGLGTDETLIKRIENGTRPLRASESAAIARALELDFNWWTKDLLPPAQLSNASSLADSKRAVGEQRKAKSGRRGREGGFSPTPVRPAAALAHVA